LELQEKRYINDEAPGLCGPKGFQLEAPGKKGKLKMMLQQVLLFIQRAP